MLAITQSEGGIRLELQVTPNAKQNYVGGVRDGALRIAVTIAPEKGKANKAVIDVLSRALNIRKSQCQVIAGETSRRKAVWIETPDQESARTLALLLEQLAEDQK